MVRPYLRLMRKWGRNLPFSDPTEHSDSISDLCDIAGAEMGLLALEEVFPKPMKFGLALQCLISTATGSRACQTC